MRIQRTNPSDDQDRGEPGRHDARADQPLLYWELEGEERREAMQHVVEDEGDLAVDINHGRRLVSLVLEYESCPDVVAMDRTHSETGEDFTQRASDAIASILAAAAWEGIDPTELWQSARFTQRAVFESSCRAARDRQSGAARVRRSERRADRKRQ